jgi:hypothetical protein
MGTARLAAKNEAKIKPSNTSWHHLYNQDEIVCVLAYGMQAINSSQVMMSMPMRHA